MVQERYLKRSSISFSHQLWNKGKKRICPSSLQPPPPVSLEAPLELDISCNPSHVYLIPSGFLTSQHEPNDLDRKHEQRPKPAPLHHHQPKLFLCAFICKLQFHLDRQKIWSWIAGQISLTNLMQYIEKVLSSFVIFQYILSMLLSLKEYTENSVSLWDTNNIKILKSKYRRPFCNSKGMPFFGRNALPHLHVKNKKASLWCNVSGRGYLKIHVFLQFSSQNSRPCPVLWHGVLCVTERVWEREDRLPGWEILLRLQEERQFYSMWEITQRGLRTMKRGTFVRFGRRRPNFRLRLQNCNTIFTSGSLEFQEKVVKDFENLPWVIRRAGRLGHLLASKDRIPCSVFSTSLCVCSLQVLRFLWACECVILWRACPAMIHTCSVLDLQLITGHSGWLKVREDRQDGVV